MHAGHVSYLKEAKSFCDLLIVGINNDASVKRLKGKLRPINNLEERQTVLSELNCVSKVISFHEDTPEKLISAIKPHILFKGADYEGQKIVGSEYSGETILIDIKYNVSTTMIIQRATTETQQDSGLSDIF